MMKQNVFAKNFESLNRGLQKVLSLNSKPSKPRPPSPAIEGPPVLKGPLQVEGPFGVKILEKCPIGVGQF